MYYSKDNKLYATDVAVSHPDFTEITEKEYYRRLSEAVSKRAKGQHATDDFSLSED